MHTYNPANEQHNKHFTYDFECMNVYERHPYYHEHITNIVFVTDNGVSIASDGPTSHENHRPISEDELRTEENDVSLGTEETDVGQAVIE